VFVYNFWLFAALSLLSAFVTDYTQLFVIRVFLGIAVGADIASSMTYLAELSPSHSRGRWTGALPQISWTLGALVSLGVAVVLTLTLGDHAWRWLFGLGALPAIIILLGRKTLPESPHWLMSQGRVAEAHESMRLLGMDIDEVSWQGTPALKHGVAKEKKSGSYFDVFRAPYTRQALLAILIIGLTPLINSPASVAAPYVMRYVGGLTPIASLEGGMLIWIGGLLGSIIALLTIDRLGRIWSTVISCWGCAICLVGLTLSVGTPWIFVGAYFVYGALIFFGASSFWCLPSELLPTHLRARAQGVGNGMARLMIGITTWLVPTGIALIGFSTTFGSLAILGIVLGVYALTGLKFEPKGLDLNALSGDDLHPHSANSTRATFRSVSD
jgi:putative MFS transporter